MGKVPGRGKNSSIRITRPSDIPVYPEFGVCRKAYNIADNPYVCEDDRGRIAFVSQDARKAYLRKYGSKLHI